MMAAESPPGMRNWPRTVGMAAGAVLNCAAASLASVNLRMRSKNRLWTHRKLSVRQRS
jgi:hypothetical protein